MRISRHDIECFVILVILTCGYSIMLFSSVCNFVTFICDTANSNSVRLLSTECIT